MNTRKMVYQINIAGERAYNNGYDISLKSWRSWCHTRNIQHFVIEQNTARYKPHWIKYTIFNRISWPVDQIAFVDADTIIHPDCPDFFDLTGNGFGVVKNFGCLDWIIRGIENYGNALFDGAFGLGYDRYFNTGFMCFNHSHKTFLDEIMRYREENAEKIQQTIDEFKGGQDQTIVNLLAARDAIDLKFLPCTYNLQDLQRRMVLKDDDLWYTDYGWIYHYNAGRDMRVLMENTYEKLWNG